jgi:hypothetical protein
MPVTITVRFQVADVTKAIQSMNAHAEDLERITQDARSKGCLSHRFVAGQSELVAIDEWESADQFKSFFEDNAEIRAISSESGATGPPTVAVYESADVPGNF